MIIIKDAVVVIFVLNLVGYLVSQFIYSKTSIISDTLIFFDLLTLKIVLSDIMELSGQWVFNIEKINQHFL
jgi:hypothetical protein